MKRYIVKPNGATDPMDLFFVEVDGHYISTTAKIYARGSYPWGKDYTIDDPAIRDDFSNNEIVEVYRKWDGCIEVSMDEHFCGSSGGAQFDHIALMMKAGVFLCDQMIAEEEMEENGGTLEEALQRCDCGDGAAENPGITFEEFSEEVEEAAEKDREKYVTYIEGPIMNESATKLAARFDDVVMGISTAGSNPFDFMKTSTLTQAPRYPEFVIADEAGSWSKASKRTGEWIVTASTADTLFPKEDKKAKRKAQKQARKQNRKK